jgi:hypothetical protein
VKQDKLFSVLAVDDPLEDDDVVIWNQLVDFKSV